MSRTATLFIPVAGKAELRARKLPGVVSTFKFLVNQHTDYSLNARSIEYDRSRGAILITAKTAARMIDDGVYWCVYADLTSLKIQVQSKRTGKRCDLACRQAKSLICSCSCAGEFHGEQSLQGWVRLGGHVLHQEGTLITREKILHRPDPLPLPRMWESAELSREIERWMPGAH